jgi:hypothetical protein
MAAYKQFNSQDIIVSPLELTKGFEYQGNALTASNVNIARYLGSPINDVITTGTTDTQYTQSAIYASVQQLYYSNYISSSNGDVQQVNTASIQPDGTSIGPIGSNAYFNFEQTDLVPEKYFPTSSYTVLTLDGAKYGSAKYGEAVYGVGTVNPTISVMSIPKSLFGDFIQPKSLKIVTPSGSYFDDGEGRLMRDCPLRIPSQSINVGNVVYEHGMVIFTGGPRNVGTGETGSYGNVEYGAGKYGGRTVGYADVDNFAFTTNITASFSSSFTIYETQYKCTLSEDEFNYSLNPTTISGSSNDGTVYNFVTSSYFSPYISTVGMYNNNNELVAVGKLAQPLPTSRTTDTTILVNIDRQ